MTMHPSIDLRETTFLKPVIIKSGHADFEALGKRYLLESDCFSEMNGKTVLINSGFEVFRGGSKIGDAKPVSAAA